MIYFSYGKSCVTSNTNKPFCSNISCVVWDPCELNLGALNCSVSKRCAVLVVSRHYLHDKPDDIHKLHTTRLAYGSIISNRRLHFPLSLLSCAVFVFRWASWSKRRRPRATWKEWLWSWGEKTPALCLLTQTVSDVVCQISLLKQ